MLATVGAVLAARSSSAEIFGVVDATNNAETRINDLSSSSWLIPQCWVTMFVRLWSSMANRERQA